MTIVNFPDSPEPVKVRESEMPACVCMLRASSRGRLARGRLAIIRKRLGRRRPSENLRYPCQTWQAWFAPQLGLACVVGEAGVETIPALLGLGLVFGVVKDGWV